MAFAKTRHFVLVWLSSLLFLLSLIGVDGALGRNRGINRGKALSFFNVVRFPNDVCQGNANRNGTCYTQEECDDRDGTASGSCADGFGVCCIISLTCGQTSSENCTYLVQSSTTSPAQTSCTYRLCPTSDSICRMKLDFNMFDIAQPYKTDVVDTGAPTDRGGAIGDCTTDSFSVSSSGNVGSPVICGFNTGQHMFIDVGRECITAAFSFGGTSDTRQYDIKVLQFECNNELAGPPGCLQFFTAETGTIASFNYPTNIATANIVKAGTGVENPTHLSDQLYDICFRRGTNKCAICYTPTQTAGTQQSFGLSIYSNANNNAAGKSNVDSGCLSDYLIIPEAINDATIAVKTTITTGGVQRLCGRFLNNAAAGATTSVEVCSGHRPFRITFVADEHEAQGAGIAAMPNDNELIKAPGGIVGFQLNYRQVAC